MFIEAGPHIPYNSEGYFIDTEADVTSQDLIYFREITYKNAHIVARQAWDLLALTIDDEFAKDVIKQRVRVLLDPDVSPLRAFSALNEACRKKLIRTGDSRWQLLSIGFSNLAIKQVVGLPVTRVYGK